MRSGEQSQGLQGLKAAGGSSGVSSKPSSLPPPHVAPGRPSVPRAFTGHPGGRLPARHAFSGPRDLPNTQARNAACRGSRTDVSPLEILRPRKCWKWSIKTTEFQVRLLDRILLRFHLQMCF